jgi:long-subunit acyl-CoA synthetase (AMP-forming)/pyrroloquinoline quinone (PQQ) biosynthesis protein C
MTALFDAILSHGAVRPCDSALQGNVGPVSWLEAAHIVERSASRLAKTCTKGRPLGLAVDHSPASALLLVALLEAGVPAIPLPPFFSRNQSEQALANAGACGLVTDVRVEGDHLSWTMTALDPQAADLPSSTAVISYSSGSTGEPKGICLAADHLFAVASAVASFLGAKHAGRHLALLPFGILLEQVAGLYASLIAGGTYVAPPSRDVGLANSLWPDASKMLGAIARHRITSLILVPEYLSLLVAAMEGSGVRLPLLTLVAVGGARVPTAMLERARAVGLPVRQGYGLTETGSVVTLQDAAGNADGSAGRSIGLHRLSIADDHEIIVEGPLFLGTVGNPRSPGPLRTGDRGRIDETGRLWIEGRKSSVIVTSFGRNISPEWVEGVLTGQPEIAQVMVRGDGAASLEALVAPSRHDADVHAAVVRANATLPPYAHIARVRVVAPFTPLNGQLTGNGRLRRSAIHAANPKEVDSMPFFDRLVAETRAEEARFATTPQLLAGLNGKITRADYLAYLKEAYHHVRHTVPLMQEARSLFGEDGNEELVRALDGYIVEEAGHDQWILDDIAAAGGDPCAVAASKPAPATRRMIDCAYRIVRGSNPVALFGMVFVLESTSVAIATDGADALKRSLDMPDSAVSYLTSHGALDQDHMGHLEALMNQIDDPGAQTAIIETARQMFELFGAMFEGIDLEDARNAA